MASVLWMCACSSDSIFREKQDFEDQTWLEEDQIRFSVEILDASIPYDVFYFVRHTRDYPFQNLYVHVYLEDSNQRVIESQLQNLVLFDPKTGEPKGSGLGSILTRELRGLKAFTFPEPGTYTIRIEQRNRAEATGGVDSFGIQVLPSDEN